MAKLKTINPSKQPQQQPQQHKVISQQWSGPLPPPAALEHFNEIIPNGADRIMSMIESEQAHRISHDNAVLAAQTADMKRGHIIGGIACILSISGAIYTSYIGAPAAVSIALVSVPILGMIKAFMPKPPK